MISRGGGGGTTLIYSRVSVSSFILSVCEGTAGGSTERCIAGTATASSSVDVSVFFSSNFSNRASIERSRFETSPIRPSSTAQPIIGKTIKSKTRNRIIPNSSICFYFSFVIDRANIDKKNDILPRQTVQTYRDNTVTTGQT